MSFDTEKKVYGRDFLEIIEIDLDYCSLTFGAGACTGGTWKIETSAVADNDFNVGDTIQGGTSGAEAELLSVEEATGGPPNLEFGYKVTNGTNFSTSSETITNITVGRTGSATKDGNAPNNITIGNAKCFNTFETTQAPLNYNGGGANVRTYRFYTGRSPAPIGISDGLQISAIPNLKRVRVSPSKIDVEGGLGLRSKIVAEFKDHPHSDIGVDKYVDERSWIASDRATFWTKLRTRNPNYQFRAMRYLSGFIVDGVFDIDNFETKHFVIESLDVGGGAAQIVGKDPLKLASQGKNKIPTPNTGKLQAAINTTATSATLTPSGIGNSEYPASGTASIDKELVTFTRSGDTLTLTRSVNGVVASHNANATVQVAYVKNDQVNVIVEDILTNYTDIDSSFIPSDAWQAEIDTYLSGLLDGTIAKPIDVNTALKELTEAAPHYLWWDERQQLIQLTALKAPPDDADILNMTEHLVADSVSYKDLPEKRVSTVIINYGQVDPLLDIKDAENFEQTYIRIDTDSISKYSANQTKVINSRWINDVNSAAARVSAALIGRRFADIPREIRFALDPKDSDIWVGQIRNIQHRDTPDRFGLPAAVTFQITSAEAGTIYKYEGLEFVYGPEVDGDEEGTDPNTDLVILNTDQQNINLRTIYNTLFPTPDASTIAKFVIENGTVIGSSSTGSVSLDTGTWPAGATVKLQLNSISHVVGAGGAGGSDSNGSAGGKAIILNHNLELINNGIIGGGGGGGASHVSANNNIAGGGGGAGNNGGTGGNSTINQGRPVSKSNGGDGELESGGAAGSAKTETETVTGAAGGALGQAGANTGSYTGGAAGAAIDKNGFTLTQTVAGDIRGSILT